MRRASMAGLLLCLLTLGCAQKQTPVPAPSLESDDPELTGPPLFKDVTAASGVNFTYRNGEDLVDADGRPVLDERGNQRRHLAILESLGGGVGLIDYDGDGLLDVFLPGGGYYADAP